MNLVAISRTGARATRPFARLRRARISTAFVPFRSANPAYSASPGADKCPAARTRPDRDARRAGRYGDEAERYIRRHPTAGVLFRQISVVNLADGDLVILLRKAEELGRK